MRFIHTTLFTLALITPTITGQYYTAQQPYTTVQQPTAGKPTVITSQSNIPVYTEQQQVPVQQQQYTGNTFDTVLTNINKNQASLNEQLKQLYTYQQQQQHSIEALNTAQNQLLQYVNSIQIPTVNVDQSHIQALHNRIDSLNIPQDRTDQLNQIQQQVQHVHKRIDALQIPQDNTDKLQQLEQTLSEQKQLLDSLLYSLAQPRDDIVIHQHSKQVENVQVQPRRSIVDKLSGYFTSSDRSKQVHTETIPINNDNVIVSQHSSRYNDAHTFVTGLGIQRGLPHRLSHFVSHVLLLGFIGLLLLVPITLLYTFLSGLLFPKTVTKRVAVQPMTVQPMNPVTQQQRTVYTQPVEQEPRDIRYNDNIRVNTANDTGGVRITQVDNGVSTSHIPVTDCVEDIRYNNNNMNYNNVSTTPVNSSNYQQSSNSSQNPAFTTYYDSRQNTSANKQLETPY